MMLVASSVLAVIMGITVIFVRMKASKKPTSANKIMLPPLFMSTGALMFVIPEFRVTFMELLEAVVVGMLFSILLIKTSNFEIRNDDIYLKRSKAFPIILITLLIVRIVGKVVLSSTIHLGQLSGMFFLLAFSMIIPWRIAMYRQYRSLRTKLDQDSLGGNPLS